MRTGTRKTECERVTHGTLFYSIEMKNYLAVFIQGLLVNTETWLIYEGMQEHYSNVA